MGSYWYSTWDMIGDSYLGSIWSTLRTTIWVQTGVQTVKCLGISHFIIVTEKPKKKCKVMAFGQGSAVTGGYRSCPAMQCGATVTAGLTAITQPK